MRAVDKAYDVIRQGIIDGRFAPAGRITEHEVAAAAGVSRTPAREALRRLHSEGLVNFTPNQGAVVTEWSGEESDEVFELRALLEPFGAARAATRATAAQIQALQQLAKEQYAEAHDPVARDVDRIAALNNDFHRQLQEAAHSPRLLRAVAALLEAPLIMKTFLNYTTEDLERSAAHHLEIVRAIAARDPEWAASVMRSHILAARRTLQR
ncbi:MAG: GntR family transcriptional regulator [Proteobacteria bacterium]|nr:GntR family transcriptional regulator [Pseudomonadota bacterium]